MEPVNLSIATRGTLASLALLLLVSALAACEDGTAQPDAASAADTRSGEDAGPAGDMGQVRDAGSAADLSSAPGIDETSTFISFQLHESSGCMPLEELCEYLVKVDYKGAVSVQRGQRWYYGNLTADELRRFVDLALGDQSLAELLVEPWCPHPLNVEAAVRIEPAAGITIFRDIFGCTGPAMLALRQAAREIARRIGSDDHRPSAPLVLTSLLTGGRLRLTPRFHGLIRTIQEDLCMSGICGGEMVLDPVTGTAARRDPRAAGNRLWSGITDFAPADTVAVSPEVIEALRKVVPCPSEARDNFKVNLHPWVSVEASADGCTEGPMNQLRSAVDAVFARLKAMGGGAGGAPDAGTD
jgi:hypothetical protein